MSKLGIITFENVGHDGMVTYYEYIKWACPSCSTLFYFRKYVDDTCFDRQYDNSVDYKMTITNW